MAEALGLIGADSAMFNLSLAGAKLLRDITDITDCPSILLEIANELSNFNQAVQMLRDEAPQSRAFLKDIVTADEIMEDIAELLGRHVYPTSQTRAKVKSRIRWTAKDTEAATKLQQRLGAVKANINIILLTNRQSIDKINYLNNSPQNLVKKSEIIIAVMGETGAGKSHFIHQITGRNDIGVGHSLHSETRTVTAYSITVEGRVVTLVDTPGFDDSYRTDAQVLEEVVSWLTCKVFNSAPTIS